MRKKTAAALLCLALCLCALTGMASAEDKTLLGSVEMKGAFTLRCALPEGYTAEVLQNDPDYHLAVIAAEDESRPQIMLSIAFDELLADVERLNDLDEAALAELEASFREEDEVEITYMFTSHGTKLLVAREIADGVSYVDFFTIYQGYEIEMVLNRGADFAERPITEEEIQMAVDFLSDLDFEPAE